MKAILRAVLLGALVAAVAVPAQAARSETKSYRLGAAGDAVVTCDHLAGLAGTEGIGGACFAVHGGESSLTVTIADNSGEVAGMNVLFEDATGETLGDLIGGCQTLTAAIPAGAARVRVFADGAVFSVFDCGTVSPATEGTITASFS